MKRWKNLPKEKEKSQNKTVNKWRKIISLMKNSEKWSRECSPHQKAEYRNLESVIKKQVDLKKRTRQT